MRHRAVSKERVPMIRSLALTFAALTFAAVSGCALDTSSEFPTTETLGQPYDPGPASVEERQIVVFEGDGSAVRAEIESRGGFIASWHDAAGIAIVERAPADADLGAVAGIEAAVPDEAVGLAPP